jgi:hypothetical protein
LKETTMPDQLQRLMTLLDVREIDEERREITAMVSTETMDSYDTILLAAGCELDRYRRNPVVLFGHAMHEPPVGNCSRIEAMAGEGLLAVTRFHDITERARDTWELYRTGVMRGWSCGFLPVWRGDDSPYHWDEARAALVISPWELYEYSAVTVPSNADALTRAAQDGSDAAQRMLRAAGLPDHPQTPEERLQADLQRALGGLQGLRNYRRHCVKQGIEFPVESHRLAEADELLRELRGTSADDDAPAPPETHPAVGDPSEELVARALTTLAESMAGVTTQLQTLPEQVRQATADGIAAQRRKHIGGVR